MVHYLYYYYYWHWTNYLLLLFYKLDSNRQTVQMSNRRMCAVSVRTKADPHLKLKTCGSAVRHGCKRHKLKAPIRPLTFRNYKATEACFYICMRVKQWAGRDRRARFRLWVCSATCPLRKEPNREGSMSWKTTDDKLFCFIFAPGCSQSYAPQYLRKHQGGLFKTDLPKYMEPKEKQTSWKEVK